MECEINTYTGLVVTTAVGSPIVNVTFSQALPDEDCCEITLSGDVNDTFKVRILRGDLNRDGITSSADASIIKPHFGEPADAGKPVDHH